MILYCFLISSFGFCSRMFSSNKSGLSIICYFYLVKIKLCKFRGEYSILEYEKASIDNC